MVGTFVIGLAKLCKIAPLLKLTKDAKHKEQHLETMRDYLGKMNTL